MDNNTNSDYNLVNYLRVNKMTNQTTQVAIIMGSDSDLPIVEAIFPILDSFGVKYTKNVMSAHYELKNHQ